MYYFFLYVICLGSPQSQKHYGGNSPPTSIRYAHKRIKPKPFISLASPGADGLIPIKLELVLFNISVYPYHSVYDYKPTSLICILEPLQSPLLASISPSLYIYPIPDLIPRTYYILLGFEYSSPITRANFASLLVNISSPPGLFSALASLYLVLLFYIVAQNTH